MFISNNITLLVQMLWTDVTTIKNKIKAVNVIFPKLIGPISYSTNIDTIELFIYHLFGHLPPFYYLLTSTFKNICRPYILLILYPYKDQNLFIYSANTSQMCPLYFLPLFLKSFNLILNFFTLLLFLIWFGHLFQKHYSMSKNLIGL